MGAGAAWRGVAPGLVQQTEAAWRNAGKPLAHRVGCRGQGGASGSLCPGDILVGWEGACQELTGPRLEPRNSCSGH